MYSRFRSSALVIVCLLAAVAYRSAQSLQQESPPERRVLRVCSDPNNLPFSNQQEQGFENRIAEVIARHMGARAEYTWFAQRRGFLRNTLNAGLCDVVVGIPYRSDSVETTQPYYRSTYVFVSREREQLTLVSMDDPALRALRIGVHIVGDDYSNPPPVHALGRRQIVDNVVGYSIYGDYSQPNPPARLMEAVAEGAVDVAIVWGPFAGYFGPRQRVPLRIVPVSPDAATPDLPFVFEISMGVRKEELSFRQELQDIIHRRQSEIDRILQEYRVPLNPPLAAREQRVAISAGR